MATTWLYALLWALFPLIGWGKYGPESFGLSCTLAWRDMKEQSQSFVITIFFMNLILPAIIIMSCYSGIALKLYVTYKSMDDSNHIPNMIKMQRRLMVVSVFDLHSVPATLLTWNIRSAHSSEREMKPKNVRGFLAFIFSHVI